MLKLVNTFVLQIFAGTNAWNFCDLLQNHKYLLVGETTMNIIKFDHAQNKMQNLIPLKCFESKICKKMYLQIIVTWYVECMYEHGSVYTW